jgi:acyl carrier protein
MITSATRFAEDLNVDSLDLVGVLLDLQDMLDVEWTDDEISGMKSVGDVLTTLTKHNRIDAA